MSVSHFRLAPAAARADEVCDEERTEAVSQSKTYRGAELEELLAQIRTELGADAVVTRLREGVVGGIGGFFGKRCLEIEAHAGENAAAAQAAVDFIPPARPFSL